MLYKTQTTGFWKINSDDDLFELVTFFSDEGQGPREHIHEVGQPVRMGWTVELPDVHNIVLVLQYSSFVIVNI